MKELFLEHFARVGIITAAAQAAGCSRRAIYSCQEHDEGFALAFREAEHQAVEALEREAWRRAVEGTPSRRTSYWRGKPVGTDEKVEYSDQLLMLLLRARKPDMYREKVDVAVSQVIKTVAGIDPEAVL
jgi:hypothetical protein